MPEIEDVVLTRDVSAIMVPEGQTTTLHKGDMVSIRQMRGDTFTVANERGSLFRIEGGNADALGKEVHIANPTAEGAADSKSVELNAWDAMKTVYDPEIPVNVVELGLIYELHVRPLENGQHHVDVVMTLTAPGCGMGPVLQGDVEQRISQLAGVASVNVEVVFDPPWCMERMSDVAKVQLGMI